jgi:hypothetical protein
LNAIQRRWSGFLSEYYFDITYINGIVNRDANALSHRLRIFSIIPLKMNLRERGLSIQLEDDFYKEVKDNIENEVMQIPKYARHTLDKERPLRFNGRIFVPLNEEMHDLILQEAHKEIYMPHLGVKKMNVDLKPLFFWKGMKKYMVNFVVRCLECQQVKDKHSHPGSLLQPRAILDSKWEIILMDFIVGLPLTTRSHNSIFVVVNMLTKSAHCILVHTTYQAPNIEQVSKSSWCT